MDKVTRSYYELKFKSDFLEKRFDEFQNLFSTIMEKRYPADFQRVRPWGNIGDRKNDGYRKSQRQMFQLYGPNEIELKQTKAKINADFYGAFPYWKDHFDIWTFVHNAFNGLAPDVVKLLLEIEKANSPIKVVNWGFEELRHECFGLCETDLASVLGPAPTQEGLSNVHYEELRVVLTNIATLPAASGDDIRPVPMEKLDSNGLSLDAQSLLTLGMRKESEVLRFFRRWHDPTFGDRVAARFKEQYELLRDANMEPDLIFQRLQIFAVGSEMPEPRYQAAALAVLAFLFAECDIFERPREEAP